METPIARSNPVITTTARNASLEDLATLLQDQHGRKLDLVVPASKVRSEGGVLVVDGVEPVLLDDGVMPADGYYRPTVVCDEGVAAKLNVPVGYLKRLRAERPDLYDANVNGWLHGFGNTPAEYDQGGDVFPADPRSFLLRCFKGDDGGEGVARAWLSRNFKIIDHLDVIGACLDGVREAGVEVDIRGCDLTDRRMYVRVYAPQIAVHAPRLLKGYRSPFTDDGRLPGAGGNQLGAPGHEYAEDIVFAGFKFSNSEVGGGAFQLVPEIVVRVCKNGLTITRDACKAIHLGGKLDDGVVRWSADTQTKLLALVTAQARDAVATFLDTDYVEMVLDQLSEKAETPIKGNPAEVVTTVCRTLQFSQDRLDGILDHFIRGGQMTAGGVMQAVTSYAQVVEDADEAYDLEMQAMPVLEVAARAAVA
jgi:hypothetical protein